MSSDDAFELPSPTITFLGGPFDGVVVEPDVPADWEHEFPDWIKPDGQEHRYSRLDPGSLPGWIVNAPQMDVFDSVYLWGPYWPSAGGGGTPAALTAPLKSL